MGKNYENRFLYRLVKVAYYLLLVVAVLVSLFGAWESIPASVTDNDKSTVTCADGNTYSFRTIGVYTSFTEGKKLDGYGDSKAGKFCMENKIITIKNSKTGNQIEVRNSDLSKYGVEESVVNDSYQHSVKYVETVQGSWFDPVMWVFLGVGGSYAVLNLLREALNYLFIGKSFNFEWIPIGIRGNKK